MDGALIVDKPAGMTSHDVVARVRRITGERRVGHTGTLDPFATGVLVLLIGRATRLAQFLTGADKEYEAVIRFGYATDTGDVTGAKTDNESDAKPLIPQSLRPKDIETAMSSFRGTIEQVPPMYSAKKVAGRRLYEHARRGEEIERPSIPVTIHEFEALPVNGEFLTANADDTVDLRAHVVCSAGTYIRTLAEDLGKKLGVGAHLGELRRTRAGAFGIDQAASLDRLQELTSTKSLAPVLISPQHAVSQLPMLELDQVNAARVLHGIELPISTEHPPAWSHNQPIRLSDELGELLAIGFYDRDRSSVHPRVVIKAERV